MGSENQRPELWSLYNGRVRRGEHLRVFPLSNWTELDVWEYIRLEEIPLPSIYFAHERDVFERDGMLYAANPFVKLLADENIRELGAVPHDRRHDLHRRMMSGARTLDEVIAEVAAARITERGATRADDRFTEAAMEDRKREGYFDVGGLVEGSELLGSRPRARSTTASRR